LTAAYAAAYDAWNRLVFVWVDSNADGDHDAGETVIARYEYDGLSRRTKKHLNADSDDDFDTFQHFYYNASWQVLETRETTGEDDAPDGAQPQHQYVWSVRYIDAPVLRDENTDQDDLCDDQRLYYTTDANMNVTALLDTAGDAVERYVYDPYGQVTILNGASGVDEDGAVTEWTEDSDQTASDVANAHLYCGYYHDSETGLYHVRWRVYHPTLGRWLQRDPSGYEDGPCLYEYVGGRVGNASDASGLHGPPVPTEPFFVGKETVYDRYEWFIREKSLPGDCTTKNERQHVTIVEIRNMRELAVGFQKYTENYNPLDPRNLFNATIGFATGYFLDTPRTLDVKRIPLYGDVSYKERLCVCTAKKDECCEWRRYGSYGRTHEHVADHVIKTGSYIVPWSAIYAPDLYELYHRNEARGELL